MAQTLQKLVCKITGDPNMNKLLTSAIILTVSASAFAKKPSTKPVKPKAFSATSMFKCYEKEVYDMAGDACFSNTSLLDALNTIEPDENDKISLEQLDKLNEAVMHASLTCKFALNIQLESLENNARVMYSSETIQIQETKLKVSKGDSDFAYALKLKTEGFASGTPITNDLLLKKPNKETSLAEGQMTSVDGDKTTVKSMVCLFGKFQ